MEPNTWQEFILFVDELWSRLQAVRAHNAPMFAFSVVALLLFEALALGALLDLLLPKHHPSRRPTSGRRRK